jgi:hypothetical protein
MTSRRLQLNDMDAAADVQRTALLHALPIFFGLHTPEEDQQYFRQHVFQICEVWGAFDDSTLVGIVAFRKDWIHQLYVLLVFSAAVLVPSNIGAVLRFQYHPGNSHHNLARAGKNGLRSSQNRPPKNEDVNYCCGTAFPLLRRDRDGGRVYC